LIKTGDSVDKLRKGDQWVARVALLKYFSPFLLLPLASMVSHYK